MELQAIIDLDLHGLTRDQAQEKIENTLRNAGSGVYRIRCIHGFHGGTAIKDMIRREFGYGLEPKVKRVRPGENEGITELILRE